MTKKPPTVVLLGAPGEPNAQVAVVREVLGTSGGPLEEARTAGHGLRGTRPLPAANYFGPGRAGRSPQLGVWTEGPVNDRGAVSR